MAGAGGAAPLSVLGRHRHVTSGRATVCAAALLALLALAGSPSAQDQRAASGTGAVVRALDKLAGSVTDLRIPVGDSVVYERLTITLADCRYPTDNPFADAFALLSVHDAFQPGAPVFQGWMIASSPALNALDHSRYDIWVLRCTTS